MCVLFFVIGGARWLGAVLKVPELCMHSLVVGSGERNKDHWFGVRKLEDLGVNLGVIFLLLRS